MSLVEAQSMECHSAITKRQTHKNSFMCKILLKEEAIPLWSELLILMLMSFLTFFLCMSSIQVLKELGTSPFPCIHWM